MINRVSSTIARQESERIETKRRAEEKEASKYIANLRKTEKVASEYLLSCSVEAYLGSYCTGKRRRLSDYAIRSVDAFYAWTSVSLFPHVHKTSVERLEIVVLECKKEMIRKAKKLGAEVVVDITTNVLENDQSIYFMRGTALIVKRYEK
ncbi:MAG TPA: hypothetical protein DCE80_01115 [Ignavibacteriales bacterium]|nr:hypothetical protein [Candidatus Woesearchaeota archaeon]HAB50774.1 hypothetical protein [Ignavibacteriales bacterium]